MPVTKQTKNQHLLWRAAFGPFIGSVDELGSKSVKKLWGSMIKKSSGVPEKIDVATNILDGVIPGFQNLSQFESLTKDQKKQLQQQSREDLKNLGLRWMSEMVKTDAQLRERMSLFWHGHFACRVINIFYQQQLLHEIRTHAVGNFGELLRKVSKSASMLQFLNNQQNKKRHPNENFAREVMELFTMGRGSYSEQDIKEAARAFTGWGFNIQGDFVFRENQHDKGEKKFLGRTGNFTGDDIIDILLEQKQTAVFITKKIYRYFVNENIDEARVVFLAERFYNNNYDIQKLLEDIFTGDWFYDEKNIGTKIKSPVDLLVGIRRFLPLELQNDTSLITLQKVLGQFLFNPPNVAGWPGGKSWIDSSTLMLRLRIPQILALHDVLDIRPKSDDDTMMGKMMEERLQKQTNEFIKKGMTAEIHWEDVIKLFEKTKRDDLLPVISGVLLQTNSRVTEGVLTNFLNTENRENYIKSVVINLMSTPEYQMC